jgi:hypothetical protein
MAHKLIESAVSGDMNSVKNAIETTEFMHYINAKDEVIVII